MLDRGFAWTFVSDKTISEALRNVHRNSPTVVLLAPIQAVQCSASALLEP